MITNIPNWQNLTAQEILDYLLVTEDQPDVTMLDALHRQAIYVFMVPGVPSFLETKDKGFILRLTNSLEADTALIFKLNRTTIRQ
jgi:hypothetical protein